MRIPARYRTGRRRQASRRHPHFTSSIIQPGMVIWRDLTVQDADRIRHFYERVIGWKSLPATSEGYRDFNMVIAKSGEKVAGIRQARQSFVALPPQWLIYILVEDVERSVAICKQLGGEVLIAPRHLGRCRFCTIRDPAGAVCALYQPPP